MAEVPMFPDVSGCFRMFQDVSGAIVNFQRACLKEDWDANVSMLCYAPIFRPFPVKVLPQ